MFERIYMAYVVVCGIALALICRGDKREWLMRTALAAGLPVIGLLLPFFRPPEHAQRQKDTAAFDHFRIGENRGEAILKPDAEREMNIVPLEEALLVNDFAIRRKAMIDVLKQDSLEYLGVLQTAVGNEDTETSHYAASAIMEVKRQLMLKLQQFEVRYEKEKDDPFLLRAYADVLKSYMRSGFLDERTEMKYRYTYSAVLERLIELAPESAEAYPDKIDTDLKLGEYISAERSALLYLRQFPDREDAYIRLMKVYFTVRSFDKLNRTLEQLKHSPVRLSHEGLTIVRFWSGGTRVGTEGET